MPGFLPGGLRRSKTTKSRPSASTTPSSELDWETLEFDPREFNPFDLPDMALTPEGRPTITSRLDPYSVVEDPHQTLSQYLNPNLIRRKTIRATSQDGAPLTRAPRKEVQPRSFERISGYHVQRPGGQTLSGPGLSHPRIRQLRPSDRYIGNPSAPNQTPQKGDRAGRSSPLARKIIVPEGEKEDLTHGHPTVRPPQILRRVSGSCQLRGVPRNESLVFDNSLSKFRERFGTRMASIDDVLSQPTPISLIQSFQRRASNRRPDSGTSTVPTDAEKGSNHPPVHGNQKPVNAIDTQKGTGYAEGNPSLEDISRGRPLPKRQKSRSCPFERSNSWLDFSEGRRGRVLTRSSSTEQKDQAHISSTQHYQQRHSRELENEPENGSRFKEILDSQENLKTELIEGHLQTILDAAKEGAPPATTLDLWAGFTGGRGRGNRKWIRQKVPIQIHDVKELRSVSRLQWTPHAIMISPVVEDPGDVNLTLGQRFRMARNRWFRKTG